MVNIVTIAIVHAVLFIAAFRLMMRQDLDADPAPDNACEGESAPQKSLSPSARRRARLNAQNGQSQSE